MTESTKLQKEAENQRDFTEDKENNQIQTLSVQGEPGEAHNSMSEVANPAEGCVPNLKEVPALPSSPASSSVQENLEEGTRTSVSSFVKPLPGGGSLTLSVRGTLNTGKCEGRADVADFREPVIDLFDEDGYILFVVELPGVELHNVSLELVEDILILTASTADRIYQQEILLPATVTLEGRQENLRNSVLEVKLLKVVSKQ